MNLLFLCTGNACRSQIAEGWARSLGGDWLQVQSAGIAAHGKNPRAIATMQAVGIDISAQQSTQLTDAMLVEADYLVTVCGHADEHCPALPASICKEHWPLQDPAKATGTEADITAVFRASRDDIRSRVVDLLVRLREEQSIGSRE
ncbi:MAG: arsenate reductase ArsC [Gammaproteobacteria bacterium]|nr:arsenate reductase ArsC [Gammaproteobacteria bacterium]